MPGLMVAARSVSPALSERLDHLIPRRRCFSPANLVAVAVAITFLMHAEYQPSSHLPAMAAEKVPTDCVADGSKTTCTCDEQGVAEDGKPLSAVLSKEKSALTMVCEGTLLFAPKDVAANVVCPVETEFSSCALDLHTLLSGNPTDVKWTECEPKAKKAGKCKTLSIPQERLPFTDQQFAVGCVSADNQKKCRVAVTIKAKASLTEGQTVTCAYGAGSNQLHQTVKLNPTHNSFTLVCGEKGEVFPQKYDETFCTSEPKGNEEACSGHYQSVLPGYEKDWWKEDKKARSFTFSIPVDQFPREPTKMVVGCHHSEKSSTDQKSDEEVPAPTACSVDVTIESRASALSAAIIGELSLLWGVSAVAFFTCTY